MDAIQVRMLGELSIQYGDIIVSDTEKRSKKVWNLLAYLICNRDHSTPSQMLVDLLWGEDATSSNPENALRILLHRARGMLDNLWEGAGHDLIIYKEGGYIWNNDIGLSLDSDAFLNLIRSSPEDEDQYLQNLLLAIDLYKGAFLPRQSGEMWAIPLVTHFQAQFLNAVMEAADMLFARKKYDEAAAVCQKAAAYEPYHEPLHQHLMLAMAASRNIKGVAGVYEKLSKRLQDDFGIQPSEETRAIYKKSIMPSKDRTLPVEEVLEDLHEPEIQSGALVCDYEHFKVLCFAESRAMERTGDIAHVALMNLVGESGATSERDSNRTMDLLGLQIQRNLRRGDVIARCSASQYIILLPRANYENSCMVCRRVIAAFQQKHGQAAKINFIVQPLSTGMNVP